MARSFYVLVATRVWAAGGSVQLGCAQEWEKVLAAAKKGRQSFAVIGPVGGDRRDVLVEPFQKKYGIAVEYLGDRGSGIGPRLSAERNAGQYLWDVAVTGTTTGLVTLLPGRCWIPSSPRWFLA